MELLIYLKNGGCARVTEFKRINYFYREHKSIDSDFTKFQLSDDVTYHFVGANTVTIKGTEISYLDIN
jgi:hypothetical protein